MERKFSFIAIFLVLILFLSLFVNAAGTGSGGTPSNEDDDEEDAKETTTTSETANDTQRINNSINRTKQVRKVNRISDYNCEDFGERDQRIRCRLMNKELAEEYNKNYNIVPEACRLAENKGRCVALYRTTQTCYKLEGRAKDACFKRAIGLRKAHFNQTQNYTERPQHAREYIITLLYNLEEKAEDQLEEEKITEEEATQLIDKITEIKALILNNGTKREVRAKITELKNTWRSIIEDE